MGVVTISTIMSLDEGQFPPLSKRLGEPPYGHSRSPLGAIRVLFTLLSLPSSCAQHPARKHIHALELLTACKRKNEDCATLCGKRVTTMPFSICYGEREIEDSRRYY